MITPLLDQQAREQALSTRHSYIVQAPAGSGKTELLIQRFLALLAQANNPEEVLAITFTRKAAAEMRARVINALQLAQQTTMPEAAYQQITWKLAHSVLERHQALAWQLIENPNRLRIQTIDALCASLTRQMPILSRLGAQANIIENPYDLYRLAAREILNGLEHDTAWSNALMVLLLHLDNDYSKVETLLCDMLAKRDQWLPYIAGMTDENQRQVLEKSLQDAINETIIKLKNNISLVLAEELIHIARFAGTQIKPINNASIIALCAELQALPDINDLPQWLGLSELIFTKSDQLRKRFTQAEGFPPSEKATNKEEKFLFGEMKARMSALVEAFVQNENLCMLWLNLRALPPANYSEAQWTILTALFQLLPILVAQLQIYFQLHAAVDYIEIAQSAITALGDPQAPSDLALALDYRIQHILVDEFQDTSIAQFRLLEQLTAGWQANDGRTLFLVGDPMQSIYRFRKAEVGLFLQARQQGIGSVSLTPLTLTVNFRSTPTIVDWINNTFQKLMPLQEDISIGAVTYTTSLAKPMQNDNINNSTVKIHALPAIQQEATTIINIIQQILSKNSKTSIAILVRARTHLMQIIPQLQNAGINYRAVEIETLAEKPHIQDLFALTCALLHLGDRIAWLTILRAPWCGLSLEELHLIAGADHQTIIWERLQNLNDLSLPEITRQRLARITQLLQASLSNRQRLSVAQWIEGTWLALGGPACLTHPNALNDAKDYFKLLDKLQTNGEFPSIDVLTQQLNKLYANTNAHADASIEIMTIHKAKGLEFDCVILPGLHRPLPADDPQLLLCMERPTLFGHADLLLAPIKAAAEELDAIYAYLYREDKKRADNETTRLLYVAATRAKKELHLVAALNSDPLNSELVLSPIKNSLLSQLWPALGTEFLREYSNNPIFSEEKSYSNINKLKPKFARLSVNWKLPEPEH